jgi:HPr kinase/phosphorylase
VLITGAAGSGKSGLALQLMALGAALVADDQVFLTAQDGQVVASCPKALHGLIEARGIGVLYATAVGPVPVCVAIDMDQGEADRLPPQRSVTLSGCQIPLFYRVDAIHFAPAIVQFLRAGRNA